MDDVDPCDIYQFSDECAEASRLAKACVARARGSDPVALRVDVLLRVEGAGHEVRIEVGEPGAGLVGVVRCVAATRAAAIAEILKGLRVKAAQLGLPREDREA